MSSRHVFICGLHRSGTSLLYRILCTHEDISGFSNTGVPEDEGQHLQTVYPRGREFGGPGKFAFARHAYLTEKSPLVTDANRKKLTHEWGRHWDLTKPLLVEKSPPNIIRSRFLQAMFPDSYFIFLVRHPIAVALATQKWSHTDLPELVEHWSLAHKAMLEDRAHIKHHMQLRYEDFVAAPEKHAEAIWQFIGADSAPVSQPVSDQLNDGYFAAWEEYKKSHPVAYKAIQKLTEIPEQVGYEFNAPYVL